jgi:transposase-like protein
MAQGRPRDLSKEQQWRQRIRQWQASGLSVRAFCARHALAQATFYAWRRLLRERDRAAAPAFVPVQVVAAEPLPSAPPLEVVAADGRWVRVWPGFDPHTLRLLLAVLREEPPC